jgi:hypothetical protein
MKPAEMASCLTPHKHGIKIFLKNRKEAAKAINYDFVRNIFGFIYFTLFCEDLLTIDYRWICFGFLKYFFNTASSAALQISLCRMMLGLNQRLLKR